MHSFEYHKIRDLGEIIADSFQYLRIHFKTLGTALLFFVLPIYIIQFFLMKGYTDQIVGTLTGGNVSNFEHIFGLQYFFGIVLSLIANSTLTVITIKHVQLTENVAPSTDALLKEIVPNVLKYTGLYICVIFYSNTVSYFILFPYYIFWD